MATYNTNFNALMNGYTSFPTQDDPGEEPIAPRLVFTADTPSDSLADSRDILSFLAAGGYTGLTDEDARGAYKSLSKTVGAPLAQKLTNQVFLFNQRDDIKGLNPEQRVSSFYEIGSGDKDVNNYLAKTKALGSGVVAGFNDSVYLKNRQLSGREKPVLKIPEIAAANSFRIPQTVQ